MTNNFSYLQRICVFIVLSVLCISAFSVRLTNFKKSQRFTIDEEVYYTLGSNLKKNPAIYNTIDYAHRLQQIKDYPLHEYFFKPLFKHPPFFPFLISVSFKIFGENLVSAAYISIFFGVLMIPLTYLLGRAVFNSTVGILAAFLMWIDPIGIICSQKIWLETTLAFFSVASIYLYLEGLKRKSTIFYILSGLSLGFALLTKYTGILPLICILIYMSTYRWDKLKSQKFLWSFVLPVVMILPWFFWNYQVYGGNFIHEHLRIHAFITHKTRTAIFLGALFLVPIGVVVKFFLLDKKKLKNPLPPFIRISLLKISKILLSIIVLTVILEKLLLSLQYAHLPSTSWTRSAFFEQHNVFFYLGRLIEFSLLYLLSYIAIIFIQDKQYPYLTMTKIVAVTIFCFYSIWGGFQSRYILVSIPFLLILASFFWIELFNKSSAQKNFYLKLLGKFLLTALGVFSITKTYQINLLVSYLNNMSYF